MDGNVVGANADTVLAEANINVAERVRDVGSIVIDEGGDERSEVERYYGLRHPPFNNNLADSLQWQSATMRNV